MSLSIGDDIKRGERFPYQTLERLPGALKRDGQPAIVNKHIEDLKNQRSEESTQRRKKISERKTRLLVEKKKNSETETSVEKVKAILLGQRVRNSTLMPLQILGPLSKHCPEFTTERLQNLAKIICRKVNEMTLNPEGHIGTSRRIIADDDEYLFPILTKENLQKSRDERKKETLSLEYNCWLEFLTKKQFRIFLFNAKIPTKKNFKIYSFVEPIGEGHDKDVYPGLTIDFASKFRIKNGIPLRDITTSPHVCLIGRSTDLSRIRAGLKAQQEVIKKTSEMKVNLPSLPVERLPDTDSKSKKLSVTVELRQEWYNGCLNQVLKRNSLPSCFNLHLNPMSSQNRYPVKIKEMLKAIIDIACTLEAMHQFGLVHYDVNPGNILIKIDKDNVFHGYLTDFDYTKKIQECKLSAYNKDYVTPFSDCYSLAQTIGRVCLGKVFARVYQSSISLIQNKERILKEAMLNNEMSNIIDLVENLVFKTIANGEKVYGYFNKLSKENPEKYQILIDPLPKDPERQEEIMKKKLKIIEDCSEALGGHSMTQMRMELEEIYKKMK